MSNNRQQRQNLQKRNRRVIRLKASKGGRMKTMKSGSKNERGTDRVRNTFFMFGQGNNPIFFPKWKKLKGWQLDHRGKKVA